jgi:hypothetical protein
MPADTRYIAYKRFDAGRFREASHLAAYIACIPLEEGYRLVAVDSAEHVRSQFTDSRNNGWYRSQSGGITIDLRATYLSRPAGSTPVSMQDFVRAPVFATLQRAAEVNDQIIIHCQSTVTGFRLIKEVPHGVFTWQERFHPDLDCPSLTQAALEATLTNPMSWISAPEHAVLLCRFIFHGRHVAIALKDEYSPDHLFMLPLTDEDGPELIDEELKLRADTLRYFNDKELQHSKTLKLNDHAYVTMYARRLWKAKAWRNSHVFLPQSNAYRPAVLPGPIPIARTGVAPGFAFNPDVYTGDGAMLDDSLLTEAGNSKWLPHSTRVGGMLDPYDPTPLLVANQRLSNVLLDTNTPVPVFEACSEGLAGVYAGEGKAAPDGKSRIRDWIPLHKRDFEPTAMIVSSDALRWRLLHGGPGSPLEASKSYLGAQPIRSILKRAGVKGVNTDDGGGYMLPDSMEPVLADFNVGTMLLSCLATFCHNALSSATGMPHFLPPTDMRCTLTSKSTFQLVGTAWLAAPQKEGRAAKRHAMFGLCICPTEKRTIQLLPMPGQDSDHDATM